MSQVQELLELLKSRIRAKGLTYRNLAKSLDVSESTLKRWFSQKSFQIDRLDDLCHLLEVDLGDLYRNKAREVGPRYLSEDQELELAADETLFKTMYLALEGRDVANIGQRLAISSAKTQAYLIRLDQLQVIELHPDNRIVPILPRSVRWLAEGPLHQKYGEQIRRDFMDCAFEGELEKLWLETGYVSRSSLDVFSRKFDQLLATLRDLIHLDERVRAEDKVNITFVSAFRPWILPVFHKEDEES